MRRLIVVCFSLLALVISNVPQSAQAADLSEFVVKTAIERGKKFLVSEQESDGSWSMKMGTDDDRIGVTGLCVLALINCGMSPQDVPVSRGLRYLRTKTISDLSGQHETYQTSLLIMALAAARDKADAARIAAFAERLEKGQITSGNVGAWPYQLQPGGILSGGDQSNTQFAILGLREAVEAGYSVNRETWERARQYWESNQNHDGGWGYSPNGTEKGASRGSMTVAGVASLSITQQMLKSDAGVGDDGTPQCCTDPEPDKAIQNGLSWLARNFTSAHNPGMGGHGWLLYYIYGVERAGRLSGQRFFGEHDWYREGTAMLVAVQGDRISGSWVGTGSHETNPVCGTSLALLFLSKGLAPVLINKLKYGARHPNNPNIVLENNWNRHPRDVRNLTELVSNMPKWPKLMTSQDLDLARAVKAGGLNALLQAPVLFITGSERISLTADETKLLKSYLEEGGFIFACPSCQSEPFEAGFRELVTQLMPPGEGELKRLPPEHPVYRSEHPLPESVTLYGADFGCRTSIMYSADDLSCLWDYWAKVDPPKRNIQLKAKIIRATQIGVNVLAYATGREPPDKTQIREVVANDSELDSIERGLLQIAQIKHEGAWNAAPRALRNLLISLNDTVGLSASTKTKELSLGDRNIFRYPVLYMHGRNRFTIPLEERQQLKLYLERGGVLIADSCCGAKPFDRAFREFMQQLFPDKKFDRIPVTHELFSEKVGRDIKTLKRRTLDGGENASGANFTVKEAEPVVEGIELDGRLAVIYSKYDISCALERQNSGSCEGYLPEDAVKLGTNIILYSMMQGVRFKPSEAAGN